jgi:tetratricopeptide (TPR) repeat protein
MRTVLVGAVFLSISAVASIGAAQGPAPAAPAAAPPAEKKAEAAPASNEVRRDPKGIKGISPYWEALIKGDKAFVARDFEGAIAAYQEAIKIEPQNPLGHYRMGEAQLAKGNQKEAEESWSTGVRFAGENHKLRAKLLFVLADLRERQKSLDEAEARWTQYEQFVKSQPESKGFAATPPERKKRIAEWKKISADSAEVKKRIDARLKEAEEATRKNAK